MRERRSGIAELRAVEVLHAAGRAALRIDVGGLPQDRLHALAALVVREARLRGAGLVIDISQGIDPSPLCDPAVPVLLTGAGMPNAVRGRRPLVLNLDTEPDRLALWRGELGDALTPGLDLAAVTAPYRMTAAQVRSATATARALAGIDGAAVDAEHIHRAARLENGWSSGRGVRHIEPAVGWSDLVLHAVSRASDPNSSTGCMLLDPEFFDSRVLRRWRLAAELGVTALFAADSGHRPGALVAEPEVARELGLDLYVVEHSRDQYEDKLHRGRPTRTLQAAVRRGRPARTRDAASTTR